MKIFYFLIFILFVFSVSAQTDKTSYYTIGDTTRIETPIRKNRGTAAALYIVFKEKGVATLIRKEEPTEITCGGAVTMIVPDSDVEVTLEPLSADQSRVNMKYKDTEDWWLVTYEEKIKVRRFVKVKQSNGSALIIKADKVVVEK